MSNELADIAKGTFCFLLGCAVGYSELFGRYQDEPVAIHKSFIAYVYMIVNGLASLTAFIIINYYNEAIFKVKLDDVKVVLLAGFSGMLALRSSFFTIKNNNKDVPIGPAALLTILLNGIDRLYDRERAVDRAAKVTEIMKGIDFEKAEVDLSVACLNLMQNLSEEEQRRMRSEVEAISKSSNKFSIEKTKSLVLGLTLARFTGFKTLKEAIGMLGADLRTTELEDKQSILDTFLLKKAEELEKEKIK